MKRRGAISSAAETAFTRVELLAVIAICLVLAAVQIPLSGRSREPNNVAVCANNLRQLSAAMLMYSADNDGYMTPHSSRPAAWPLRLLPYYRQTNVLHCPSDAPKPADFGTLTPSNHLGPRSYILNGFNDYTNTASGGAVPLKAIRYPADTILFGEKETQSGHWWLDYNQFDDIKELEQARHFSSDHYENAGSNHAFADGSVRFLKFGQGLNPVMLWFVEDEMRNPPYYPF